MAEFRPSWRQGLSGTALAIVRNSMGTQNFLCEKKYLNKKNSNRGALE
jgi:hypothetical protein